MNEQIFIFGTCFALLYPIGPCCVMRGPWFRNVRPAHSIMTKQFDQKNNNDQTKIILVILDRETISAQLWPYLNPHNCKAVPSKRHRRAGQVRLQIPYILVWKPANQRHRANSERFRSPSICKYRDGETCCPWRLTSPPPPHVSLRFIPLRVRVRNGRANRTPWVSLFFFFLIFLFRKCIRFSCLSAVALVLNAVWWSSISIS